MRHACELRTKAAPRFELGIKDLQSSALPLGHAAERESQLPSADRISQSADTLVVVCNGHGEDLIALRVLEQLRIHAPSTTFQVLPLVGEGKSFENGVSAGWLQRIGPCAQLPSGGFSNQSLKGLAKDLLAGLTLLSWRQWHCLHQAAKQGAVILAVGDFLPLVMAWSTGGTYGFIGTPKSDFTWRSGPGQSLSDRYHRLKGSEWDPWEWALMRCRRCLLIAVRDKLTARALHRKGVEAVAPGNPMMDGLLSEPPPIALKRCRKVLMLCGSRMPEAIVNFKRLLRSLDHLASDLPVAVLVAVGSQPNIDQLEQCLASEGYRKSLPPSEAIGAKCCWVKGGRLALIGPGQFNLWASWAEVGLTTAGTATEQLVGLGIPAVSLPGNGPQFKQGFAKRQSRLLGGAVLPCQSAQSLAEKLNELLENSGLRQRLGEIGQRRMGSAGGSHRLADLISKTLLEHPTLSAKNLP